MMKFLLLFASVYLSSNAYSNSSPYDSNEKIGTAVESDEVYFLPEKKENLLSWTGLLYVHSTQKCFSLLDDPKTRVVRSAEVKCSPSILEKAKEPYDSIDDFKKAKEKFLMCLKAEDSKCLRRLTFRNVQISFGVDGLGDRRDKLYPNWKKTDFEEAYRLLNSGTSENGNKREFPFPFKDNYVGNRGAFEKKAAGWLLVYYLAGD